MLKDTGERYLPFLDPMITGAEIHYEHLHRYAFASKFVKDKYVLDLASGEGYGSYLLSNKASGVIGVEINEDAVAHSRSKYLKSNLEFKQGSILNVPVDGSKVFDVIVCFEALEHVEDHGQLFSEVKRLLKDDGLFLVSTPNKRAYSDEAGYHNPFHLKELNFDDFKNVLLRYFSNEYIYGQRIFTGSNIWYLLSNNESYCDEFMIEKRDSNFAFKSKMDKVPMYFISIASDAPLDRIFDKVSYLIDKSNTLIVGRDNQISLLEEVLKDRDNQIATISRQLKQANDYGSSLKDTLKSRNDQIISLSSQLQQANMRTSSLENEIAEMRKSAAWQLTMKFHNGFVEQALPLDSKRRKWYDLGVKGMRILVNEGSLSFCQNLKKKFFDKKNNESKYELWIQNNEPNGDEFEIMKKESRNFPFRPKISIITPVWNTDERWLKAAIESVIAQIYNNWELCIVDGGSTKRHVKDLLENYARKDERIKVKFLDKNMGIAGNSNEAFSISSGEFIGFLDHDDELAPFALYEIVKLLNKNPNVDFIYSDEDKIEGAGKRCDAFFKPDWSPDLMLSCMYTCHLGIYRRDLVSKIGGFREGFEGSQDYDFVLRFTEYVVPERIAHISKILYHWRKIPGSIASEPHAKNCINVQSAKMALNDMLIRRGIKGNVYDGKWISSYRIKRDLTDYSKVSIIIPTRDNIKLLKSCIDSIKTKTTYKNYELIVVDNNSIEPETIDYLSKLDNTVIKYPKEFNFSEINNFAANFTKGDYLLFLNNDTEVVTPDWIETMLEHAQRPEVGAVGCKLLYSDNTIQHAGVILGLSPDPRNKVAGHIFIKHPGNNPGYFGLIDTIRNYSAVTAAAMMIRKDTFLKVGCFDENLAVSYNDVDLCLKIREKGFLIVYTPYAEVLHHESKSRGGNLNEREVDYMLKKWGNVLKKDPYYNPNLSLRSVYCEVDI